MGDNFDSLNGYLDSSSTDQGGAQRQKEGITNDHGSLDFQSLLQARSQPHAGPETNGAGYWNPMNTSSSEYPLQDSTFAFSLPTVPSTSYPANSDPLPPIPFSLPTSNLPQSVPRQYQSQTMYPSFVTPSDPSLRQPYAPPQPPELPTSFPSFPTSLPSSSSSASKATATRATPVLPFPSRVLEQEERAKPRTSLPPLQAVPFTQYRHPSADSGSPFSARSAPSQSPEVSVGGNNSKSQFGGRGGGIGSKGRESYLTQKSFTNGRDGTRGVNGVQRVKGLSRNGSEVSGFGEEDDEDEDAVVLISRQHQSTTAARNGVTDDQEVVEETPEPRIVRSRRKRARSPSSSGSEFSSPESGVEEDSGSEFEGEKETKGNQGILEEARVTRRRKRRSSFDPEMVNEQDGGSGIAMDVGSGENEDSEPREVSINGVTNGGESTQSEIVFPKQNGTEIPDGWVLQSFKCTRLLLPGTKAKKREPDRATTAKTLDDAVRYRCCSSCRSRLTGSACSFKNMRAYRQLSAQSFDLRPTYLRHEPDRAPDFPQSLDFNAPFTTIEANLLKSIAADKLGPTMEKELQHASQAACRRVSRDVSVINNCDTCLHVMLCGSWLCEICGKDVCFDCYSSLVDLERGGGRPVGIDHVSAATLKTLGRCFTQRGTRISHKASDFVPLTRIDADELATTVQEMEQWRKEHPVEPAKELPPGWLDRFCYQPHEEENSHPYLVLPSHLLPPTPTQDLPSTAGSSTPPIASDDPLDGLVTPSLPTLPEGFSTLDFFRSIWSRGEAFVVDIDLTDVSTINWSPEYFVEKFGTQEVTIGSNLPGVPDHTETVGEFFRRFGQSGKDRKSEKIKDWPPSTDFRQDFPELWQDFNQMLPIGAVTRRDGVLNISTHTPKNANPPDLGPKGYFSEISDDTEGGQGSTKLHMGSLQHKPHDAADAVNVLLWASPGPHQTQGFAIWDLYRAEDADKIREFLYELIAERDYGGDVERARMDQDDPIHTQRFFLDQKLRKELWEKKGVKSWRIHQKPSQVVFVPAGCAHQVCNFSDCIKVASDFVSIENVGRCWKVTDEFRQQTKEQKVWKNDILGLKCQLLWAWESAKRLDSR
ncbi:hypothetical protein JCM3765_006672 [Sporobolomyces pararoseus]